MNPLVFGSPRRRLTGRCGVVLLVTLAAGCGGGNTARVSGRVLQRDGTPLPGGQVTFFPSDNTHRAVTERIDENGNYRADLPVGEVKIAVDNRELEPVPQHPGVGVPLPPGVAAKIGAAEKEAGQAKANPAAAKRPPGTYVPIPPQYYDTRTSGLSYTVRPGSQPHDIELK